MTPEAAKAFVGMMKKTLSDMMPGKWLITMDEARALASGIPKDKVEKFMKCVEKLKDRAATVTAQRFGRVVLGRGIIRKEKANMEHCTCVAHEILSTEEKYYEQLSIMIDVKKKFFFFENNKAKATCLILCLLLAVL